MKLEKTLQHTFLLTLFNIHFLTLRSSNCRFRYLRSCKAIKCPSYSCTFKRSYSLYWYTGKPREARQWYPLLSGNRRVTWYGDCSKSRTLSTVTCSDRPSGGRKTQMALNMKRLARWICNRLNPVISAHREWSRSLSWEASSFRIGIVASMV